MSFTFSCNKNTSIDRQISNTIDARKKHLDHIEEIIMSSCDAALFQILKFNPYLVVKAKRKNLSVLPDPKFDFTQVQDNLKTYRYFTPFINTCHQFFIPGKIECSKYDLDENIKTCLKKHFRYFDNSITGLRNLSLLKVELFDPSHFKLEDYKQSILNSETNIILQLPTSTSSFKDFFGLYFKLNLNQKKEFYKNLVTTNIFAMFFSQANSFKEFNSLVEKIYYTNPKPTYCIKGYCLDALFSEPTILKKFKQTTREINGCNKTEKHLICTWGNLSIQSDIPGFKIKRIVEKSVISEKNNLEKILNTNLVQFGFPSFYDVNPEELNNFEVFYFEQHVGKNINHAILTRNSQFIEYEIYREDIL